VGIFSAMLKNVDCTITGDYRDEDLENAVCYSDMLKKGYVEFIKYYDMRLKFYNEIMSGKDLQFYDVKAFLEKAHSVCGSSLFRLLDVLQQNMPRFPLLIDTIRNYCVKFGLTSMENSYRKMLDSFRDILSEGEKEQRKGSSEFSAHLVEDSMVQSLQKNVDYFKGEVEKNKDNAALHKSSKESLEKFEADLELVKSMRRHEPVSVLLSEERDGFDFILYKDLLVLLQGTREKVDLSSSRKDIIVRRVCHWFAFSDVFIQRNNVQPALDIREPRGKVVTYHVLSDRFIRVVVDTFEKYRREHQVRILERKERPLAFPSTRM